jgi:hypothetical protein
MKIELKREVFIFCRKIQEKRRCQKKGGEYCGKSRSQENAIRA